MRLNYYQFPAGIDAKTRFLNGADFIKGQCRIHNKKPSGECPDYDSGDLGYGCKDCNNFCILEAGDIVYGTTISNVKKLLKTFGGSGWTDHCDRSGGVFEVTEIFLKGNNSSHHYNRHL
ncbi:hypothetical protein [Acetobacterium woodii]|uniref:hypothetical protein n=1 Tax=Acetobacterium woodii TaxID=33952 RepID=UPI0002F0E8BB|nr:hypothetical protein [Acetobacterium woodii]